jgi:hypothetical protein
LGAVNEIGMWSVETLEGLVDEVIIKHQKQIWFEILAGFDDN